MGLEAGVAFVFDLVPDRDRSLLTCAATQKDSNVPLACTNKRRTTKASRSESLALLKAGLCTDLCVDRLQSKAGRNFVKCACTLCVGNISEFAIFRRIRNLQVVVLQDDTSVAD